VSPGEDVMEYVDVVFWQIELLPVTTGFGRAGIETVLVTVAEHPELFVTVTDTVPELAPPHVTFIELELDGPFIVPPVTDHAYVQPAINVAE
jgi:hypothetical protein